MAQNLNAYLRSLGQAGTFDSDGRFTVDVQKKNVKIRENRFSEPHHYLLCCVRAGVTASAERLSVRLNHGCTVVEMRRPKLLNPRDVVESALGAGRGGATDDLLGASLQGALAAGARAVRVSLQGAVVHLTPDSVDVVQKEAETADAVLEFDFGSTSYKAKRRRCLEECQALMARCAFCPVPLSVDGFSVIDSSGWESLFRWQRSEENYGVHPDFIWMEAFLDDSDSTFHSAVGRRGCRVEYLGGKRFKTTDWDPRDPSVFLRILPLSRGKRHQVGALVRLGSSLEGPGRLYLVKQGVTLEPIEEDLGAPGVGVVVRGDEFDTDLSLFKPVLDERYEKLVRGIRGKVRALASQLGRERKNFTLQPRRRSEVFKRATVFGSGGAAVGLLAGPVGAVMLGGAFFVLVAMICAWRNSDQMLVNSEQKIRWELDAFIDQVAPPGQGRTRL